MMRFDGGLATTLQTRGLAPYTPVNDWLLTNPERITEVHREFMAAGCDVLLSGTFRALSSVDSRWQAIAAAAVAALSPCGVPWWGSVGPGEGATDLAYYLAAHGASGILFETFVHPQELAVVLETTASVGVPRIGSLVVADSGRLYDGSSVADAAQRCLDVGAVAVGLNCAPIAAVLEAFEMLPAGIPVVLRPSPGSAGGLEACAAVAHRLFGLGGCCGASPQHLQRLWQSIDGG